MFKTDARVHKNTKTPGRSNGAVIDKSKIFLFINIFNKIKDREGNYEKARVAVRMGHASMSDMKQKRRLSVLHARRILEYFNRITALKGR